MKSQENVPDQNSCQKVWKTGADDIFEVTTGQAGKGPDMVHKVFGLREPKNGTETTELLQAGTDGYPRVRQNAEEDPSLGRRWVQAKDARSWSTGGQKRRITRKECWRLLNKFEMEGFHGAERIVESRWRKGPAGKRSIAEGRG